MKIGDLVKHHDPPYELCAGLGLVTGLATHPHRDEVDFVHVKYGDFTDWIDIEDLEIVNESR